MSILFISPPFAPFKAPSIGIPLLSSYLKSRGIAVHALDLNLSFFHRFLSRDHVSRSLETGIRRLIDFNERPELTFTEACEYLRAACFLHEYPAVENRVGTIFSPLSLSEYPARLNAVRVSLGIASLPYYPESIGLQGDFIKYLSPWHEYSTQDILRQTGEKSVLSGFFGDALKEFSPDTPPLITGISISFSHQVHAAFRCAAEIRKKFPDTHINIGGSFVSCNMRNVSNTGLFSLIDSIIVDDGEVPLEMLHRTLAGGNSDFDGIPGLIYMKKGSIIRNDPAPFIPMNDLTPPDYTVFDLDRYLVQRTVMMLPFRLSRGCQWRKCSFCRTDLPIVRHFEKMTALHAYESLKTIHRQTGCRIFLFTDESSSVSLLREFSKIQISEGVPFRWLASVRFDPRLDLETCMLFKQAGCDSLTLGLEAYNDRILKLMKKGITTSLIDSVLSNLAWAGLKVTVYMITGFPTETEEEAMASFNKVRELREQGLITHYYYSPFQILAHSEIANNPEQYGIRMPDEPDRPDLDLDQPRFSFESEGMQRDALFRLAQVRTSVQDKGMDSIPTRFTVDGRDITLKYDPGNVREILTGCGKIELCFGDWIKNCQEIRIFPTIRP